MKNYALLILLATLTFGCAKNYETKSIPLASKSPVEALEALKDGNERFLSGDTKERETASSLKGHLAGQNPYAMVISCADSRVPVEQIFDAGVGEVFVMRVAGNVATSENIGSAEFATLALKTPVLMVLGHTYCGAVMGSLEVDGLEVKYPGELQSLLEEIRQDVVEKDVEPSVEEATKRNVLKQVATLRENSTFANAVAEGKLLITGGVYNIGTGEIEFLN